jgi:hypothetical protein
MGLGLVEGRERRGAIARSDGTAAVAIDSCIPFIVPKQLPPMKNDRCDVVDGSGFGGLAPSGSGFAGE